MRKYRKKCVAKWDFAGDESKEQLSFKKGDVIVIVEAPLPYFNYIDLVFLTLTSPRSV